MSGSCDSNNGVQTGLPSECPTIDIRCVPETSGQPTYTPSPDQLPTNIDTPNQVLWVYSCGNGWVSFSVSLCRLNPVDISVINNVCDVLKIPVTYNINGECIEGNLTLDEVAQEIYNCLGLTPPTIFQEGDNITFDRSVDFSTGQETIVINSSETDVSSFTGELTDSSNFKLVVTEGGASQEVFIRGDQGVSFSGAGTELDPVQISVNVCEITSNDDDIGQLCF